MINKLKCFFVTRPEYTSGVMFICLSIILRLLPHPPNFAPIGALALFAGAHYSKRIAYFAPLTALVISDLFLGFYPAFLYVYGAFALVTLIGSWLKESSPAKLLSASLLASVAFFLVSNFGMWITGNWFPHNLAGLMHEYALGIPFFRNTVTGDLIYTSVFFYSFSFAQSLHIKYIKNLSRS